MKWPEFGGSSSYMPSLGRVGCSFIVRDAAFSEDSVRCIDSVEYNVSVGLTGYFGNRGVGGHSDLIVCHGQYYNEKLPDCALTVPLTVQVNGTTS